MFFERYYFTFPTNLILIGIIIFIFIAWILHQWIYLPMLNPLRKLNGPKPSSWFFGSQLDIMKTKWSSGLYPEPLLSWVKKFGGIVHYRAMANTDRILITDPGALKHVLVTNAKNYERALISRKLLGVLTGKSLLTTEGKEHAHQRNLLNPHFQFSSLKEFIPVFQDKVNHLIDNLKEDADNRKPVDMHKRFIQLTMDVIGLSAFGYSFDSLMEKNNVLMEAYNTMMKPPNIFHAICTTYLPGYSYFPTKRMRDQRRCVRVVNDVVDGIIEAKLNQNMNGDSKKLRNRDLIDLILQSSEYSERIVSTEELRSHVLTFMGAGHETTSNALCWIFVLLAQHPEVEERARAECIQILEKAGKIGWEELSQLQYLTAVIKESQRMYPAVPMASPRVAKNNDILSLDNKKIEIPKKTTVVVSIAAIHRNPKYWSEPDTFIPDRFIEGSKFYNADSALRHGRPSTFSFMPFSIGEKNCIGYRFAFSELQTVTANLLLNYSFQLATDADVNPKMTGPTIKPVKLSMVVKKITKNI